MGKRTKGIFFVAGVCGLAAGLAILLLHKQHACDFLRGGYSVVVADKANVSLNDPPSRALIGFNTLELVNPSILSDGSATQCPDEQLEGKYLLVCPGPFFAEQTAAAVRRQHDDEVIMASNGLKSHGSVAWAIEAKYSEFTYIYVYRIDSSGIVKDRRRVCVTHLRIE